ncbi:MAG TPA: hypothetical protein VGB23_01270 [Nitrospirota bacterium]|jgi:hypothetical protein
MKRTMVAALMLASFGLYGCPPVFVEPGPHPGGHVPPGQIRRQENPSGHKPIPPGQMKKMAPAPAPVAVIPVPPLPPLVVFDVDPFYYYEGYYYYLDGGAWYYSGTKGGKRVKLPKSHYPKEVKHKDKHKGKKKGR